MHYIDVSAKVITDANNLTRAQRDEVEQIKDAEGVDLAIAVSIRKAHKTTEEAPACSM